MMKMGSGLNMLVIMMRMENGLMWKCLKNINKNTKLNIVLNSIMKILVVVGQDMVQISDNSIHECGCFIFLLLLE